MASPAVLDRIADNRKKRTGLVNIDSGKVCTEKTCISKEPIFVDLDYLIFSNEAESFTLCIQEMGRRQEKAAGMRKKTKASSTAKGLPKKLRLAVWRQSFGDMPQGACFACTKELWYSSWHCGHILARNEGGKDEVDNLRPVCEKCNLSMKTTHMYLYILANDLPGAKNIPRRHPIYCKYHPLLRHIGPYLRKIADNEAKGITPKLEAKKYRKYLRGKDPDKKLKAIAKFAA